MYAFTHYSRENRRLEEDNARLTSQFVSSEARLGQGAKQLLDELVPAVVVAVKDQLAVGEEGIVRSVAKEFEAGLRKSVKGGFLCMKL